MLVFGGWVMVYGFVSDWVLFGGFFWFFGFVVLVWYILFELELFDLLLMCSHVSSGSDGVGSLCILSFMLCLG